MRVALMMLAAALAGPMKPDYDGTIVTRGDLERPYSVIAEIKVSGRQKLIWEPLPTEEQMYEKLAAEARKMGGDAVIFAKPSGLHMTLFHFSARNAKGTVVKFTVPPTAAAPQRTQPR